MTPAPGAKAVFVGCMRDCAQMQPHVLRNLERMSELYSEAAWVFVENDSRDGTKQIIAAWCRGRPKAHLVTIDGLGASCPVRTMLLALARTQYLAIVASEFGSYQHLVAFLVNKSTHFISFPPAGSRNKLFDLRLADSCARVAGKLEQARLRGAGGFAPL